MTQEPFSEALCEEIRPLGQKCFDESTLLKADTCAFYGDREFALEPDIEQYRALASAKSLQFLTLRDSGVLVGYIIGITYRCMHHKKIKGAIGDSMYIEPEYRSYAGPLVDRFLEMMTAEGAGIVGWPVTPQSYLHKVLVARGFVEDDVVMEKRLPCA